MNTASAVVKAVYNNIDHCRHIKRRAVICRSGIWWCCSDLNGRCFSLSFFRITIGEVGEIQFKVPYWGNITLSYFVDHLAVLFGDLKCLCKEIQSIFAYVKKFEWLNCCVWVLARLRVHGSGVTRETYSMVSRGKHKEKEIRRCVYFFFTGIFLPQKLV
jgi:hypothetical protein